MQSGKRLTQLAVAGVAVAALVTGCGSSSGGNSVSPSSSAKADGGTSGAKIGTNAVTPQALLASSVDKTLAAKNADIALTFKGGVAGKEIAFTGTGVIDFTGQQLEMTLNLPASTGLSGTIEERLVDKVLYLKLPAAATAATGGKPWAKIDASTLKSDSSLGSLNQNPADILGSLRNVSSSITTVGTEVIRGVKTTHYRANIDLAKAAAASGSKSAGLDQATIDQYKKALGSTSLPADVYLDSSGLPARFGITVTPAAGSATAGAVGSVSTTIDFFNYGKADTASIVAPPASEVGSLPTAGTTSG